MARRFISVVFLISFLLAFFSGCSQSVPEKVWDGNLGTTTSNILMCNGRYAMANGLVYIDCGRSIVEYDMETGNAVELPLPGADSSGLVGEAWSAGTLFLMKDGLALEQQRSYINLIKGPDGNVLRSEIIRQNEIALLGPDGMESIPIEEFGSRINRFVPLKKQTSSDPTESTSGSLAGLDFVYSADYDTFPEVAEQLAALGITLDEPEDPEERNKYIIPALFFYNGDTGESKILERSFVSFFADNTYIYVLKEQQGERELYRSGRQEIDFQPLGLGSVGNKMCSYDGTLAFVSDERVHLYQNEEVKDLPVQSVRFLLMKDKLVFVPLSPPGVQPKVVELLIYDMITGETEHVSQSAYYEFAVLEDRYVAYREVNDEYETDILYDLETGERIEMYRTEVE